MVDAFESKFNFLRLSKLPLIQSLGNMGRFEIMDLIFANSTNICRLPNEYFRISSEELFILSDLSGGAENIATYAGINKLVCFSLQGAGMYKDIMLMFHEDLVATRGFLMHFRIYVKHGYEPFYFPE